MFEKQNRMIAALHDAIERHKVRLREVRAGERLQAGGDCLVEVLHPPRQRHPRLGQRQQRGAGGRVSRPADRLARRLGIAGARRYAGGGAAAVRGADGPASRQPQEQFARPGRLVQAALGRLQRRRPLEPARNQPDLSSRRQPDAAHARLRRDPRANRRRTESRCRNSSNRCNLHPAIRSFPRGAWEPGTANRTTVGRRFCKPVHTMQPNPASTDHSADDCRRGGGVGCDGRRRDDRVSRGRCRRRGPDRRLPLVSPEPALWALLRVDRADRLCALFLAYHAALGWSKYDA